MRLGAPLGAVATALVALAGTGCGGESSSEDRARLTVSAASSLKAAFSQYAKDFSETADVRISFAGSDELAAQIRSGLRPDVYAAANTRLPRQLFEEGLVQEPVIFAGNRLVVAVAPESRLDEVSDLARAGLRLAVGSESVPVGAYTREVLDRLPDGLGQRILANVRSNEPDVAGIVGKLTQGAVDAGFVYATDVEATGGRLASFELPARVRPVVAYGVAAVKGSSERHAARAFIAGLLHGAGRERLRETGFEPPPRAR